jgi:hypothetical protein
VDELKKTTEFMRQKYELGVRASMGMTDEEILMKLCTILQELWLYLRSG